jgi:hypothetical protein
MKRRITLAGIGLAAALAAVPAIALAQTSDPDPATTVACPFHAEHAALHGQMHGIDGTMGGAMHAGMYGQMGSMMGQMNAMTQG